MRWSGALCSSCLATLLDIFALHCGALAVAASPLGVDGHPPPSSSELCIVELFQIDVDVGRGLIQDPEEIHNGFSALQLAAAGQISLSGSDRSSILQKKASLQEAQTNRVGWIIVIIGLALPALAQVAVLWLGSLPPPRVRGHQPSRWPAASVCAFTAAARIGLLANFTVIIPFAASMSQSSGQGSDDSGYLIAMTSLGALAGLSIFWWIPIEKLRLAYLGQGIIMFIGNLWWSWAGQLRSFAFLTAARVFVGLEAGAGYNSGIATAYHAKGAAVTACFVANQCCQDLGILLGPLLASMSTFVVRTCISTNEQLQEEAGNLFMALWGFALAASLLLYGPLPKPAADEAQAALPAGGESQPKPEVASAGMRVNGALDDSSDGKDNTIGLLLFISQSSFLRHAQRLLFESGMIYILQEHYNWAPEKTGFVMLPVVVYCVLLEIFFVTVLEGRLSDKSFLLILELKQVLGCFLMLYGARGSSGFPLALFLGGMCTYGANAVCGGVNNAFCTKRSIPGSIASLEGLMVALHIGTSSGCFFGALASRVVLGESPSPNLLVLLMLGTCFCQLCATLLTMEMQEDGAHLILVLGVVGALMAYAFEPALTSTGLTWHVIFMGLAWAGAAPLGMWALKTQHIPEKWQREGRQWLYGVGVSIAAVCSAIGLVAAIVVNHRGGLSLLGGIELDNAGHLIAQRGWTCAIHAILGCVAVIAVVIHLITRALNMWLLPSSSNAKGLDWNLNVGRCVCSLALLATILGLWINESSWSYSETASHGWSPIVKVGLSAGLAYLCCIIIFQKDVPVAWT